MKVISKIQDTSTLVRESYFKTTKTRSLVYYKIYEHLNSGKISIIFDELYGISFENCNCFIVSKTSIIFSVKRKKNLLTVVEYIEELYCSDIDVAIDNRIGVVVGDSYKLLNSVKTDYLLKESFNTGKTTNLIIRELLEFSN
ncbi:MAG: hypothetical protein ACRC5M_02880 [Anaeroplasmataceae bacterium]